MRCPCISFQRLLTRIVHQLARIETRWFKQLCIRLFIDGYHVDLRDAVETDATHYRHLNALFTRALKPTARPFTDDNRLGCPVDGRISQMGTIQDGCLIQAKDRTFTVADLLGDMNDKSELADAFQDGRFMTLYLAPRDYHRVHNPITATLREMRHIPGTLFSVMPLATQFIDRLYARNERLVMIFETERGLMALIMVGALNVASLETVWAGVIQPDHQGRMQKWDYTAFTTPAAMPVSFAKGAELGRFNLGSTVILLLNKAFGSWCPELKPQQRVRVGQSLTLAQD